MSGESRRLNAPRRRVAALVAALAVSACQPQDETPGLWLDGETAPARGVDWRFTNDIEEVFIETRPWYGVPHSTTIWCVELDGELYVGSYGDEKKTWEKNVARDPRVKLLIAGKLHPLQLAPVTEPDRIAALDVAYAKKYDMAEVFGDELPDWWYYHATPLR